MSDYRDLIETYLADLERGMVRRGGSPADAVNELRDHLLEVASNAVRRGGDPAAAVETAIQRFGPARPFAGELVAAREDIVQRVLLPVALTFGLAIAWIDTRPHWDDTGITVGLLLLSSAILGAAAARRVWLIALAVGVWLPAYYLATNHQPMSLLILGFPLVGAYAGNGLRRLVAPAR